MKIEEPIKNLFPSAIIVSDSPVTISTILGSCVSVCLWDTTNGYGGMNHYMLPYWNGKGLASPKFGNIAMDVLLNKMLAMGSNKKHLQAKVFGGGNVLQASNNQYSIGIKNIELAMEFLSNHKIPMISSSVGGNTGRKIYFNTMDGSVLMKLIKNLQA